MRGICVCGYFRFLFRCLVGWFCLMRLHWNDCDWNEIGMSFESLMMMLMLMGLGEAEGMKIEMG